MLRDTTLRKRDWCEKSEMGMTKTFLELKLHIQSSLNWPKTDLGHFVFSQAGKQINTIGLIQLHEAAWQRGGGAPPEPVWCQGWGQAEGQHLAVLVPSLELVRLPTLPQEWNLPGRWQHKPLIKYTQDKFQLQTNRNGDPFSPLETLNEMVALAPLRM